MCECMNHKSVYVRGGEGMYRCIRINGIWGRDIKIQNLKLDFVRAISFLHGGLCSRMDGLGDEILIRKVCKTNP